MQDKTLKIPAFGLTGGIATGKSTVAEHLERFGATIVDADRLGNELLIPGSPAYPQVISTFGREVLTPAGEIDRKLLAAIVFADRERLQALDGILHPLILQRILEITRQTWEGEPGIVIVVEATLIYEARIERNFLKVIATWCRPEQQLERLLQKGFSQDEAEARIASQIPAEEKRRRADYRIDCSTTLEATRSQVESLYPELQRLAAGPKAES